LTGRIIKGVGGFYYVEADGLTHECRAAGRIRLTGLSPRVGDIVEFDDGGNINEIKKRKNELLRPAVANVDMLMVVMAAHTEAGLPYV
jgi:ribosome biogenesis GTPase